MSKIRPVWIALVLLALAVLSLFGPALRQPTDILLPTFSTFSDILVIHWPKAQLMAQTWQAGQGLPYWNPLILSGMPLAANQLAMLFYPPAWLFLTFSPEIVFNLLFIFHLLLGGFGIYFLLREGHQMPVRVALLGGITFALNGKLLAHAAGGHVSMVAAIGWMAWVAFGTIKFLQSGHDRRQKMQRFGLFPVNDRLRWAILVAVALTMQIFTHMLILIYSLYLMLAMVAWHTVVHGNKIKKGRNGGDTSMDPSAGRSLIRALTPLLTIAILTGLLGAVQLLPLLELARHSNRALSLSQAVAYAVSPLQLIVGLLLPSPQAGHEATIYLGLVPLLLAPFGLTRRNHWSWFYGALFVLAVLFSLGPSTPVHSLFYHFVPGFRWVRTPARIFFVGAMALAVLTGFGIDRLLRVDWSAQTVRWLIRLVFSVGSFAFLVGFGLAVGFGQLNRAALALALIIPAGLILILLRAKRIISARVAWVLLGILLYIDLASFDLSLMRFIPRAEALAPGRPAAEYLAQKPGLFRVYSPSYSLPMQTAAAAGLTLADGIEPVHLAAYDQYMARAGGYDDDSFAVPIPNFGGEPFETALRDKKPDLKLLGLLNVNYLVSAFPMPWADLTLEQELAGTYIYRNERAMPRAWVARRSRLAETDWLTQLAALSPAYTAVVEHEPAFTDHQPADTNLPDETRITHYSPNLIEIEVDHVAEPGGWLVLSEIWYPGWQATVNGSPLPVERVNGLLRGLFLKSPGPFQVILTYQPHTIVWGRWITGLTVIILLGGLITSYLMDQRQ